MRVLYLTDPQLDYLADQLFTGLWKVLGRENVIDFPYKPAYHDPSCQAWYLPQYAVSPFKQDMVLDSLREKAFDLAVVSAPRRNVIGAVRGLMANATLPPLVLVDGEDDDRLRWDTFEELGCGLYFKREFREKSLQGYEAWSNSWHSSFEDHKLQGRVFPLPFSAILDTIPHIDVMVKDVDVSFFGRASNTKRIEAVNILKKASGIRFEGGYYFEPSDRKSKVLGGTIARLLTKLKGDSYLSESERGERLPPCEYYSLLARSKMALSVRGGGFDTPRYWEIVACKTLLISERPDIHIPNNFEDKKHALFCRADLGDLVETVRTYASDDAARERVVEDAYAHLLKYHTCERRAEYFLDTCRRIL